MSKTRRDNIIGNAKKYLGEPYVWGGESKAEGGYDCSGYVYNVLRDSGFKVNRSTANGYRSLGKEISKEQMQKGDLLYFGKNGKATHIAIYAGNGTMYESVGSSANSKKNPGKGVICSNVSRRRDLMEVRTLFTDGESVESKPDYPEQEEVKRSWLQLGDEGPKVTDMQIMLIALGYSCGSYGADGDFGKDTKSAVEKFQRENGIKVDGLYGENSRSKLESLYIANNAANTPKFVVGQVYTLHAEMKVRTGPGTEFPAKSYNELTVDGRKHDADGDGALDKGTRVTCKELKKKENETWILAPSGWIAAIHNGKIYIK